MLTPRCAARFAASVAAVLVAILVLGIQTSAHATTKKCQSWNPKHTTCLVWVTIPDAPTPIPATPSPTGGDGGAGATQGPVTCTSFGKAIPCQSATGTWSQQYECYIMRENPPPPAGSPEWGGHDPSEGAIYSCDLGVVGATGFPVFIPGVQAPTIDPATLAQQIAARLDIHAINIGIVPKPGPGSVGLVGMPVWMWVNAPNANTYGPITDRASAGGITVTATAEVKKIVWDMGDGSKATCTTAGTPYEPQFGKKDSPDCGHTYTTVSTGQPHGVFAVTASSYWVVDWAGAGQSGTITLAPLTQTTNIQVGELQVLVQ